MEEDACEQCGSRRFYVQDGNTYCENGHDQNRGAEVGEDEDDYGTQGKRITTKEHTKKAKVLKAYRGKKAYRLFLQAYQHILWKQCYALIHEKDFPNEIWTIVRDLWSLRLSKLLHRLEDPLEGDDSDAQGLSPGVGSQDESGGESEGRSKKTASNSPTLIDTICLCYMAIILMRLPVSLSQVLRWIREEDVPYIRAIRHVPAEMKDKLPGEYHEALDTSIILRPEVLQAGVLNLSSVYKVLYGMEISPLNSPPMLYDYVKNLSLPLEVYGAVKKLNDILKFDFKYGSSGGGRKRTALAYPEAQIMSLVVVGTKLLFPFDNHVLERHRSNLDEKAIPSIDWNTWLETRTARKGSVGPKVSLESGNEINVKDTDVFDMSAQQLDHYMDWYQRTWTRSLIPDDDVSKELFDMFPVPRLANKHADPRKVLHEAEISLERVKVVQETLQASEIITDDQADDMLEPVLRPGMRYQQFRDHKALNVSPVAHAFYTEAAELSCLSLDMLVRAVLQTERKITLWRRAKRRAQKFGEDINLQAEGVILPGLEGIDHLTLAEAAVDPDNSNLDLEEDNSNSGDTD